MIPNPTQRPIQVVADGSTLPHLTVTVDQLTRVRELLDQHQIDYWVESHAVSINRQPAVVAINFGWKSDPVQMQMVLDQGC